MEPVHVSPEGSVFIHDDDAVVMSAGRRVTKASALLGYVLVEYVDGDEADPTRTDCVDKYVMDALENTSRTRQKPPAANRLPIVLASVRLALPAQVAKIEACDAGEEHLPLCTNVKWGLHFW